MDIIGRRPHRLLIALVAAAVVLVTLIGAGLYGLLRGPGTPAPTPDHPTSRAPLSTAVTLPTTAPRPTGPQQIRENSDPESFALQVAAALFTWDTAVGYDPTDYAQVIVDVGDPTGNEGAGLASDVRSYLPTTDAWVQLRQYQTRQWLVVEAAAVPGAWVDAVEQAAPGQLLPGTTAYTITGTRHRSGIWGTEPVDASSPVAFTMFVTCAPSFEACRLLRLSVLDNPLR